MKLYVFILLSLIFVIMVFLVFRVIVKRDYKRLGKLSFWSVAAEWFLILSWVTLTNFYLDPGWPASQSSNILQVPGWFLLSAGSLFFVYALFWLGWKRSHGLAPDKVMQSGPYRFTRNPQIVGFITAMIGFLMIWFSWYMLGSLFLLMVFSHVMVLTEEEHLFQIHKESYMNYCSKTPRYLGF